MKKKELIAVLAQRTSQTEQDVTNLLAQMGTLIAAQLTENKMVYLAGLGQFEVRKKTERISVNPSNGKRYLIPPKLVPVFKPTVSLKKKLKERGSDGHE